MTTETRTTIELKDIIAVEMLCTKCGSRIVRPITLDNAVVTRCSRGCQVQWFIEGSREHESLVNLLRLIHDCAQIKNDGYKLQFEVKGLNEARSA
jgi:hypothetical protein